MRIQHNIMAMNAYRNYNTNNSALSKNLEKLSSGYKINRAGDDAAGLAISEKMRAQITGLETAQKNAKDGVSLVQTAEGALTEVHDMLNRMVELADQSANGTYDDTNDRAQLQKEVTALKEEINRIADSSNFNGIKLLDGSLAGGANVSGQIGNVKVDFSVGTKTAADIGTTHTVTLAADENTAKGIKVTFGANGALSIQLGTQGAASYTAEEIQQAVRDAATAEVAKGNNTNGESHFTSFTMTADGVLNFSAGAKATDFTTTALTLNNGTGTGMTLQIGDSTDSYNQLKFSVKDIHTASLGIADIDISTQAGAQQADSILKAAINTVSDIRGGLGAVQNRLDHTMNNLSVMTENIQDAESSIRDTDVAEEMMDYTKNNILVQSAQAMLAQANQVPQGVLQLLQ